MKKRRIFESAFSTYEVLEQLGEGGSGAVYAVEDGNGVVYALKTLRPALVSTDKRKRLQNEIVFCMRHDHPNVIKVLDHGVCEHSPFYVMERFPLSLRQLMLIGLSGGDVLPLFSQMLDGIEAAHLLNVCHRDIKPENFLCNPQKNIVVAADFGIARFTESELHTLVETRPNDRLANFVYAAPEQRVRKGQADQRTDIFSLGVILNEMFTDRVPQGAGYTKVADVSPNFAFVDEIIDAMIKHHPE